MGSKSSKQQQQQHEAPLLHANNNNACAAVDVKAAPQGKEKAKGGALHKAREAVLDIVAPPVERIPIYYKENGELDTARYTRDELRQVAWQLQNPNKKRNGLMDTQGMVYSFV